VKPHFADRIDRILIKTNGMGIVFAGDIANHSCFERHIAELLENGRPKTRILKRSCSCCN